MRVPVASATSRRTRSGAATARARRSGRTASASCSCPAPAPARTTRRRTHAQTRRAGVSLHHWSNRLGRLHPTAVALIRRTDYSPSTDLRHLLEARLARKLATGGWTLLNTRTSAPTANRRCPRPQRLWAAHTGDRIADKILGELFHGHQPSYRGGNTREQLIRALLRQRPPRAIDTHEALHLAAANGIRIGGATPHQSARRDLSGRETDTTGRPRIYTTRVHGRAVFYDPAHFTAATARAHYRTRHPVACHRPPATRPSAPGHDPANVIARHD